MTKLLGCPKNNPLQKVKNTKQRQRGHLDIPMLALLAVSKPHQYDNKR